MFQCHESREDFVIRMCVCSPLISPEATGKTCRGEGREGKRRRTFIDSTLEPLFLSFIPLSGRLDDAKDISSRKSNYTFRRHPSHRLRSVSVVEESSPSKWVNKPRINYAHRNSDNSGLLFAFESRITTPNQMTFGMNLAFTHTERFFAISTRFFFRKSQYFPSSKCLLFRSTHKKWGERGGGEIISAA